jgi:hypothetical protein
MEKPDTSTYTPSDFLQWRESKLLELAPKFQRRAVWKNAARAALIESLIQGMPVPPICLRNSQSPDKRRVVREVVDGQQRIRAVLDFIDDKFRLSKTFDQDYAGSSFSDLAPEIQAKISTYPFTCRVFQGISDSEVLEVFARLNSYAVALNAQELRNGTYFGYFKTLAYSLAFEHVEFWRNNRIFTEQSIARMLEVELTSELLIAGLQGMQDKKKTVNKYYADYDEEFDQRKQARERFRQIVDVIGDALQDGLLETEFRRPPMFYTLYCVVYHRVFGLPKVTGLATPKHKLGRPETKGLRDAVIGLSEVVAAAREKQPVPKEHQAFIAACLSQTDNIKPRQTRLEKLYLRAF